MLYNAAALRFGPTISELDPETFDEDVQIGISSAMRAIKAALPPMVVKKKGTILLTGGNLSDTPHPMALTLSVAKAGIRATGKALFEMLKDQGVHIATLTVSTGVTPGSEEARQVGQAYWEIHTASQDAWQYERYFGA
ncbi:MAG: SDR family NAD(P)-dependent oxidoreductase [Proteobacteria bacterium]|nr:MAG: SDR family NAD(P)-dependent oxidoreductase [Pseudomonadota bacterium]